MTDWFRPSPSRRKVCSAPVIFFDAGAYKCGRVFIQSVLALVIHCLALRCAVANVECLIGCSLLDAFVCGLVDIIQRSSIVMLPTLVGSPPRRAETLSCGGDNSSSMQTDEEETTTMENDATPRSFSSSHGRGGNTSGGVTVAAAAAAGTVASGEPCAPPTSLQLGSSWSDSYPISSGKATTSSSPGAREVGSTAVHAAPSPAGSVPGMSGSAGGTGGVTIVDFSPTWDFAPGGAKLLICLAAPIDADPGSVGPIIFFADRAVQVS